MAWAARILDHVCFNLTFQSEQELAAIAAGMSLDSDPGDARGEPEPELEGAVAAAR